MDMVFAAVNKDKIIRYFNDYDNERIVATMPDGTTLSIAWDAITNPQKEQATKALLQAAMDGRLAEFVAAG